MINGVGLVLAGGGGKGAYQVGAWKALKEFGIDKNIIGISGTSVGALNALLFAQDNYEIVESVWRSISTDKILKVDIKKVIFGLLETGLIKGEMAILSIIFREFYGSGMFSREGLLEIIDKYINYDYIRNSTVDIFATSYNISTFNVKYFKINTESDERIKKILLASSALPIIFDKVEIDGEYYIDGGVKDNVPIKPLYDEGIRNFIVLHLGRESLVSREQFKDSNIIEIVPSKSQGDLVTGTLDFTKEGADRRINQGYQDTIKVLKPLFKMRMVQANISKTLEKIRKDEMNFKNQRKKIYHEREKNKNILNNLLSD